MTNRIVRGNIGGGNYGIRISRPGFDVLTEAFGSTGISLDSRITDMGTVVACGLILCDSGPISFPTMPYVPICHIERWDGTNLYSDHVQTWSSAHQWLPAVGIVTTSSIEVKQFTVPWQNTFATINLSSTYFVYFVFASG